MTLFKTLGDALRPEKISLLIKPKGKKSKGFIHIDKEAKREIKLIKKYER
jgi:hypothetical protein